MNILIAGVGYHNLSDMSLGPSLTRRMQQMDWPAGVDVDADLSFGPIAIVQRFQEQNDRYARVVLFGAVQRGRKPGTVTAYQWPGKLPSEEEIQARIGEAVTGVVSLDNLLIIGEYFGIWPQDLIVVEVEPQDENWGNGFSPPVQAALKAVIKIVSEAALHGKLPSEKGLLPFRQTEEIGG